MPVEGTVLETTERLSTQPEGLSFELNYEQYGKPIDFFGKYHEEIQTLDKLRKTKSPEYDRNYATIFRDIFDRYFKSALDQGQPIFINAYIRRKECIPSFFRYLISRCFRQMGIKDKQILADVHAAFSEALENFPRYSTPNNKNEDIPLKLLIDQEKIQLLVGRLDLPVIDSESMQKLLQTPDPLKYIEGGRGMFIIKDSSDQFEVRGKAKQELSTSSKPLYEDMAYLISKNLSVKPNTNVSEIRQEDVKRS